MQYQLPNGRVITMTINQYLDLTDSDIQMLIATDAGDFVSSPFHGSSIGNPRRKSAFIEDVDHSIDYYPEGEEISKEVLNIQDNVEIEDLPDYSDEDTII